MNRVAGRAATGKDHSLDRQIVVFRLHNELFGLDIADVNEITELLPLNIVPRAPDFIAGAINYHGRILAILSLSRFFDLPSLERGTESRIIVLISEGFSIGFLVDGIDEIAYVPEGTEEENPMEGKQFKNKYIKGVVNVRSSIVNFIDIESLLTDLEEYFKEVNVEY